MMVRMSQTEEWKTSGGDDDNDEDESDGGVEEVE